MKLHFCCSKWANELDNANSARPSDLAKCYHQQELSVLIISHLKNQIDARIKSMGIGRQTICRAAEFIIRIVPYQKRVRLTWLHSKCFSVPQACDTRRCAGKLYVTNDSSSSSAMSSCHETISLWFEQVHSVQNNISKSTLHRLIGLQDSITFRNKILMNFYEKIVCDPTSQS